MNCPKCGGGSRVTETRPEASCNVRYRQCNVCSHKFRTKEVLEIFVGKHRGFVLDAGEVDE